MNLKKIYLAAIIISLLFVTGCGRHYYSRGVRGGGFYHSTYGHGWGGGYYHVIDRADAIDTIDTIYIIDTIDSMVMPADF